MASSTGVLTYAQFIAMRETQDEALRREFTNVHTRIDDLRDDVNTRIDNLRDDINTRIDNLRDDVNTRIDKLSARLDAQNAQIVELSVDTKRNEAASYNARLRNPLLPIRPIPAYYHGKGLVFPTRYPRNAKAFFKLRKPSSDSDEKLLVYLVRFYDVHDYERRASDSDTDGSEEDVDAAQQSSSDSVSLDPHRAVEALTLIFGLEEDNFVDFQHRAAAFARNVPPPTASKRATEAPQDRPVKRLEPPKLEPQVPLEKLLDIRGSTHTSTSSKHTRLLWGTPSEERKLILRHLYETELDRQSKGSNPGEGSPDLSDRKSNKPSTQRGQSTEPNPEEGSPTNPYTSSSLGQ